MNRRAATHLTEGSVLILSGTLTPESVPLNLKPYWKAWRMIGNSDGHVLDQDLRRVGWNFFFTAGIVQGYMLGGGEGAVRRATQRVLAKVKPAGFNCVQVSEIAVRRFLGVPYVRVAAYSRHVQKSNVLESLPQRMRTNSDAAWSVGESARQA